MGERTVTFDTYNINYTNIKLSLKYHVERQEFRFIFWDARQLSLSEKIIQSLSDTILPHSNNEPRQQHSNYVTIGLRCKCCFYKVENKKWRLSIEKIGRDTGEHTLVATIDGPIQVFYKLYRNIVEAFQTINRLKQEAINNIRTVYRAISIVRFGIGYPRETISSNVLPIDRLKKITKDICKDLNRVTYCIDNVEVDYAYLNRSHRHESRDEFLSKILHLLRTRNIMELRVS